MTRSQKSGSRCAAAQRYRVVSIGPITTDGGRARVLPSGGVSAGASESSRLSATTSGGRRGYTAHSSFWDIPRAPGFVAPVAYRAYAGPAIPSRLPVRGSNILSALREISILQAEP